MSIEWQNRLHGITIKSLINILSLENSDAFVFAEGITLLILDKDKKHSGSIYLKEDYKISQATRSYSQNACTGKYKEA